MRIVSVLPSATEIVCALGHEADLVGRSEECDYPPEVRARPAVMRAKQADADRPSDEIDARVREVRGRGESLYALDIPLLTKLAPDLLITQDLCGVCSVTEEEVVSACLEAGVAPAIVSLAPRNLSEVWDTVGAVARAIGDGAAGDRIEADLRARSTTAPTSGRVPLVAIVEWLDPPILAGLWTPDIVRAAGGDAIGPCSGEPGIRTTWEEIDRSAPDLVVLSPCSFSVKRTETELERPALGAAVARLTPRLGTYIADEAYFSRPGPRLADGIDLVRGLLTGGGGARPMPVRRWESSARKNR
ncbi:MAG: cobalamin-binding protein [Thermoplasmata archaeon]